jgi:DNA-binding PadR family transcriptional regulator
MSTINLFLLGFIRERARSAYEMANFIEDHQIPRMIKISSPAVYKNLVKLAREGYLATEKVKEGEMPEKTIYSITPRGEERFYQLLEEYSKKQVKFHFDFNAVIISLDKLEKAEAERYLRNLRAEFYQRKALIEKNMDALSHIPVEGRAIIRQFSMINNTLIEWLEEFMEEYLR